MIWYFYNIISTNFIYAFYGVISLHHLISKTLKSIHNDAGRSDRVKNYVFFNSLVTFSFIPILKNNQFLAPFL